MKKLLLSFFACVASVAAASADEVTFDFLNNTYGMTRLSGQTQEYNPNPCVITDGAVTITVNGEKSSRLWADGLRFYKGATFTIACNGGTVTAIEFTGKANAAVIGIELVEGAPGTYTVSTADDKVANWTGSAASVDFKTNITKGNIAFPTIKVTYTGGAVDNRKDAGLAFSETEVQANLGEAFTAPTLTKETNATVTYSSDKEAVATVDATTGEVAIVGLGTAKITAKAEANDEYKAGSASYTITVIDPTVFWAPECKDKTNSEFTFVTLTGDFEPWSVDDRYGLKASAFKNNVPNTSDAVAASKVLDFTDYVAPMTLDYRQAINQFKIDNVLIEYTNKAIAPYLSVVAKAEGETEWTKIGDVNVNQEEGSKFGWGFFDGAQVDLAQYAGKKVQIGFRYVSTDKCAGTWEIDNVVVRAKKNDGTVAIEDIEAADAPVEYYNLQGIRVANPTSGLYIKRQGNKVTKVIL